MTLAVAIHFVWGASVPLPPALAEGWSYIANPEDWLYAHSPQGSLYFVACIEGDYCLYHLQPSGGADVENPIPLPIA
jgi:hypothetical protein